MRRKDCDSSTTKHDTRRGVKHLVFVPAIIAVFAAQIQAGSIRVWPTAVVVDPVVRLSDLCDLRGFPSETEQLISELVVTDAPPEGGSRIVHMDMIRDALSAGGANMATVMFRGSVRCEVSRPTASAPTTSTSISDRPTGNQQKTLTPERATHRGNAIKYAPAKAGDTTLRQTIIDYFNDELRRYGGTANVAFDRRNDAVLDLTDRDHAFAIRLRRGQPIGLTSLEVDVIAGAAVAQTVPLVVQVTMNRRVVAARRSINQGATIRTSDVHAISTVVTRLDNTGLEDPAMAIGQRAKRFISVGTMLSPTMLEEVPLVKRGELVRVASSVGGIKVVTTAKAAQTGLFGEVIRVRSLNDRKNEFDAVVVGPGQVEISAAPVRVIDGQVAMRLGS